MKYFNDEKILMENRNKVDCNDYSSEIAALTRIIELLEPYRHIKRLNARQINEINAVLEENGDKCPRHTRFAVYEYNSTGEKRYDLTYWYCYKDFPTDRQELYAYRRGDFSDTEYTYSGISVYESDLPVTAVIAAAKEKILCFEGLLDQLFLETKMENGPGAMIEKLSALKEENPTAFDRAIYAITYQ